jgi:hypothetical protein
MSRIVTVARYVASAVVAGILAMLAAPRLIWEAGRWVLRAFSPQPQAPQAERELVQQVEEVTAAVEAKVDGILKADVGPDFDVSLGRAALDFLFDAEDADPILAAMLTDETKAYLSGLSREHLGRMVCYSPERVGSHISGGVQILGLPRVPTYREYQAAEFSRLLKAGHTPNPADYCHVVRKADVAAPEPEEELEAVRFGR